MTTASHNRDRATPHRNITTAVTFFPLRPIGGNLQGAASRCSNVTPAGANPMTRFSAARRLLLLSSMSLALVAASGCKPKAGADGEGSGAQSGELVIGAYLSLTGSKADFGIKTQQGALLAIDEANAAGGIGGRPVKLVILDDQGTADEAGNAVTRLIDVEKASAIMGEVSSSLSLVGGRIAQRRGIPMVSPSSTNTQVTEIGNFVFRTCFIDPFQGEVMATFAKEKQGFTRIAVIKDVRNDYSIGLAKSFIETFTKNGGTIVAEESYNEGDTDFSAQLTKIKALDAQALFVPGYYTEVGNLAKNSRRLGLNIPLLGGDGWESPKLREIGGNDIVGSFYSNHFAPDNANEKSSAFIATYTKRWNEPPTALATLGYDATALIIDAMRRAKGEPTPAAIRDALEATKAFPAITGAVTFDANRNPVKPAVVLQVTANGDKFVTEIQPAGAAPAAPAAPVAPAAPAAPGSGAAAAPAGSGSGAAK